MNLEDIQRWIVSLIKAEHELEGVPVIADNGSYPKIPEREAGLRTVAIAQIVWQIESEALVDDCPASTDIEEISIAVVIDENLAITCLPEGLENRAEKALRLVRKATLGKKPQSVRGHPIHFSDPAFKNVGSSNGFRQFVLFLKLASII